MCESKIEEFVKKNEVSSCGFLYYLIIDSMPLVDKLVSFLTMVIKLQKFRVQTLIIKRIHFALLCQQTEKLLKYIGSHVIIKILIFPEALVSTDSVLYFPNCA